MSTAGSILGLSRYHYRGIYRVGLNKDYTALLEKYVGIFILYKCMCVYLWLAEYQLRAGIPG